MDYQNNFCEYICKNMCRGGIIVWAHVLTHTCTFLCTDLYQKNVLLPVFNMSLSFKFHTDLIFSCGNICKNWAVFFFGSHCIFPFIPFLPSSASTQLNFSFEAEVAFFPAIRKWQNDCFVTKWQHNFHFLCDILKWHLKLNNFWKRIFLIWCLIQKADEMTAVWPNDS